MSETLTKAEMLDMLEHCCAPDCQRDSAVITALRIPLGPDRPAIVGIGAYCSADFDPACVPSYVELLHAADTDDAMAQMFTTLLSYWPRPIVIKR